MYDSQENAVEYCITNESRVWKNGFPSIRWKMQTNCILGNLYPVVSEDFSLFFM